MTKLDRYIIKQFLATLVFGILALCVIFVVVSLFEKMDKFIDKGTPAAVIVEYYINYLPDIIKILFPVGMLLSSLFTTGRLANNNEITAMKTGGMSLYRYMLPFIVISIFLSFGQLYFNGWIVPKANRVKSDIEREYLGKGGNVTTFSKLDFRDAPLRNVRIRYYDDRSKNGNAISIDEFSSERQPRLLHSVFAPKFTWDAGEQVWRLFDAVEFFEADLGQRIVRHDSLVAEINIEPDDILNLQRKSTELTFDELRNHIDLARRGGKDVRREMIDYYGQYALPFANFIVVLFGVPFSSGKRKAGLAIEIATAMVVAFTYLVFSKLGQTIGYAAEIDPAMSGWLANSVFFVAGIVNIIRMRT